MKVLNDLVHAMETMTLNDDVKKALDTALNFLKRTRVIDYEGPVSQSYTALKLKDYEKDLDDIIKTIAGKQRDVEFKKAHLILIIEDE